MVRKYLSRQKCQILWIFLLFFTACSDDFISDNPLDPSNPSYEEPIVTIISGPASDESFEDIHNVSKVKTKKIKYSLKEKELFKLYKKVRKIRRSTP